MISSSSQMRTEPLRAIRDKYKQCRAVKQFLGVSADLPELFHHAETQSPQRRPNLYLDAAIKLFGPFGVIFFCLIGTHKWQFQKQAKFSFWWAAFCSLSCW